jgi:AcrR family transcriptional regulator
VTDHTDARRPRWEATHRRIYDVALDLFDERGFEQVSVGQIAEAAGISVPTFYAHYPSKEHVIMQVPTAEDMEALMSSQPASLTVAERILGAAPIWFDKFLHEDRLLTRWRIIATTPSLRARAAEFERTAARLVADALPTGSQDSPTPAERIVVHAYLAAFTEGMLAWADAGGTTDLQHELTTAFAALQGLAAPPE